MKREILVISIVVYGVFLAIAHAWAALAGRGFLLTKLFHASPSAGQNLILAICIGALVALISLWMSRIFQFVRDLEAEFRAIFGSCGLGEIAFLSIISGLSEELLFRGAMQPVLGLVPTSLLFGLAHFPVNRKLVPWTIFAISMGFILGALYDYTGWLLVPVITHAIVNFFNLLRICHSPAKMN